MIRALDLYPPAGGRGFKYSYEGQSAKAAFLCFQFTLFVMFTVYVLYSPSFNKIYIGFSSDLEARIHSHNFLAKKWYTMRIRPWNLIYTEAYSTIVEATKRENELKSARGRDFIWKMNSDFSGG